tara:strand:- start:2268 stop:2876 length:609 start_codon:yes stop_codon:yes gene_type:complete
METSLENKADRKLKKWQGMVERLNVQLHLGAADAKDAFEEQKKELESWLQTAKSKLKNSDKIADENTQKIQAAIDELKVQAALGKAETKDELEKQQKELSKNIQQLKVEVEKTYKESKETGAELMDELDEELEEYQTKFDLFKLQLHLGKAESKEYLEEKKKEAKVELQKVETLLQKGKDSASDNWDNFTSDISKAWKQMRS